MKSGSKKQPQAAGALPMEDHMSNSAESQVIAPLSDAKKDEKKMKRRYETKKERRAAAAAQGITPVPVNILA